MKYTLSALQAYILSECAVAKGRVTRGGILKYYKKKKPSEKDQINIIHKSISRLIKKGLIVGYGRKTKAKWFYSFIKLTPKGRKVARQMNRERQQKLF